MSRFRNIAIRVWGDEKVRRLTAPPPCGQSLWIWLLACPKSILIPGVIPHGRRALAESLDWPQEGFDEAFRELEREGLAKADWRACLVWVRNAIRYNEPQSPNVILSWRHPWDELPDCELKSEVWKALCAWVGGKGKGFQQAFAKACPNPYGKPSPMPLANQEQDQDQDQEQEKKAATADAAASLSFQKPTPVEAPIVAALETPTPAALVMRFGTSPEPMPPVRAALDALAEAAGSRFAWTAELLPPKTLHALAAIMRRGIGVEEFALFGAWLAAGGAGWAKDPFGPSFLCSGRFGEDFEKARRWHAMGRPAIGRGHMVPATTPEDVAAVARRLEAKP